MKISDIGEFGLINRIDKSISKYTNKNIIKGIGDDCAVVKPSKSKLVITTMDTLIEGVHFDLKYFSFFDLGWKSMAVNLSDMAAMGAVPRWATLAIALPGADEIWLEKFSAGFFSLAQQHGVELVGGDTTRGPLNLCVTILGEVPAQQALRRGGAQIGDEIWVSGQLGDAALALAHLQGRTVLDEAAFATCAARLHQPQPRVALGLALRGIAGSAIDVSDGLLADLGHVLDASQVCAEIEFGALPVSGLLRALSPSSSDETTSHSTRSLKASGQVAGYPASGRGVRDSAGEGALAQHCILSGGDDYELCFTVPAARHDEVLRIATQLDLPLSCIGGIVAGSGCIVRGSTGETINIADEGYDHFR